MISPKNESWDIDDSTIVAAEAIESHLLELADRVIDPPKNTEHYLCIAKHPKLKSETPKIALSEAQRNLEAIGCWTAGRN